MGACTSTERRGDGHGADGAGAARAPAAHDAPHAAAKPSREPAIAGPLRTSMLEVHHLSSPGVPPDQVLVSVLRLLGGAAYRAHRVSAAAHHETHRRVKSLPYTFPGFCDFVEASVRVVLQLGVLDARGREAMRALVAATQRQKSETQRRIKNFDLDALPPAARACHVAAQSSARTAARRRSKMRSALLRATLQSHGSGGRDEPPATGGDAFHKLVSEVRSAREIEELELADAESTLLAARGPLGRTAADLRALGPEAQGLPYAQMWNVVVWEELDESLDGAMVPNAFWYDDFMPLLLEATMGGRPRMDVRTEPELDRWFGEERAAGGFEPFGQDVVDGWAAMGARAKRLVMLAWEGAREYLHGIDKRRERDEEGARHRSTGYLSSYIPFVDVHLGRGDVEASAMRLSFPYYIGTATWLLLHTVAEEAAIAGERGTLSCTVRGVAPEGARVSAFKAFLRLFARNYPCPYCRHHLNAYVVVNAEAALYPLDYLLLGGQRLAAALGQQQGAGGALPLFATTLDEKLASIKDGASLRLFVWKLHNAVNSSIARSETWFHKQQTPLITSRYWPSIDAELARARWLADGAAEGEAAEANLSRQRVGGVYAVLKPATHVEALRVQLLEPEAAHGPLGEKERHALLHAAREDVAAAERAVVASGVLGQYRLDRGYRGSAREQAALRERYRPLGPSADAAARSGEWTHF